MQDRGGCSEGATNHTLWRLTANYRVRLCLGLSVYVFLAHYYYLFVAFCKPKNYRGAATGTKELLLMGINNNHVSPERPIRRRDRQIVRQLQQGLTHASID